MAYDEKVARLHEIHEEMMNLLDEARRLVAGTPEEERAKGYWLAHIRCALDNDHHFLGGSMLTMKDTIDSLENPDDDEE